MTDIAEHYNYWISVILMMIGLYNVMASSNLVKKLVGLGIFQSAVFLMYISMGKILGGTAPIANNNIQTILQSTATRTYTHSNSSGNCNNCGRLGHCNTDKRSIWID